MMEIWRKLVYQQKFILFFEKISLSTNLIKLFPSLSDKVPTLNSLLPILSELASSKNKTMITPTTVSTLPQTTPDELILPPVFIPRLQVANLTPSMTAITKPIHLDQGPVYSNQRSKQTPKDITTELMSLEMFNKATSDLNAKGIINLKKIQPLFSV